MDVDQQNRYVSCYLDAIHRLHTLLPVSSLPSSEDLEISVSYAIPFGVLDSNNIAVIRNGVANIYNMQLASVTPAHFATGLHSLAVPPKNFFTYEMDGPDYSQFAALSNSALYIYNWKLGQLIHAIPESGDSSDCLKNFLYLTKKHLISTSKSRVLLWDVINKTRTEIVNDTSQIMCLENIGNGRIATAGMSGNVKIWKAKNDKVLSKFKLIATLKGHDDGVLCMCLAEKNLLCTSGWEKVIKVWDLTTNTCIKTTESVNNKNIKYLLSLGRGFVVSSARGNSINIWDIQKGTCVKTLNGHTLDVLCLDMLDNTTLLSGSLDGTIRGWKILSNDKMLQNMFMNLAKLVCSSTYCDLVVIR
jgi:WD40 repeat protein